MGENGYFLGGENVFSQPAVSPARNSLIINSGNFYEVAEKAVRSPFDALRPTDGTLKELVIFRPC
jgi:hypothetical protein